jgi:hypothetical protein
MEEEPRQYEKHEHRSNVKVHRDVFGRVYFDECETDEQHLTKPAEDGVRTHCRLYLDRVVEELVGKRGNVVVHIVFQEG